MYNRRCFGVKYSYNGIILDANSKTTKRIGDNTMEIEIGKVFEFEGTTLQAIETKDMTCTECYFKYCESCNIHCIPFKRVDKKNVIFKEIKQL